MKIHKFRLIILLALALLISGQQNTYAAKKPRHEEWVKYYSPDWAPDSKHIVYIKKVEHLKLRYDWLAEITKSTYMMTGRDFCICRMNVDTQTEEIIRNFRIREWYRKRWRATWIAKEDKALLENDGLEDIVHDAISTISVNEKTGDILMVVKKDGLYLLEEDGSKITKIIKQRDWIFNPHWSPDGKQILYQISGKIEGKHVSELWLVNADGSNKHLLVKNASHGIWHPSGKKIGFYIERAKGYFWTINTDGTDKKAEFKSNCYPSDWSPDGKYINFVSTLRDIDGKRVKTEFKDIPTYGRFSPDGLKMVGGSLDITFSKIGDKKETILLKNYSRKY